MGIQIIIKDGLRCPVVFCDQCNQVIENARTGNFEWHVDDKWEIDNQGQVYFTHKQCSYPFEESRGGRHHWHCDELQLFPLFLGHNLKISDRDARRLAQGMHL